MLQKVISASQPTALNKRSLETGVFALIFTILSMLFLAPTEASASTPQGVQITDVRMEGSGCADSASAALSDDARSLSILFDNYMVEIGKGTANPTATTLQKNCRIKISLNVPRGWTYALEAVDHRGFASVPASAWAFHRFSLESENSRVVSMREASLKGPFSDSYEVRIAQKPGRNPWAPCNRTQQTLSILSQLGVSYYPRTTDRSQAMINLDSTDLSMAQDLKLTWKQCQ